MKIKSSILKSLLCVMSLMLLLSGCVGNDNVSVNTDNSVAESLAQTVDTAVTTTAEANAENELINFWTVTTDKGISLRLVNIDMEGDGEPIEIFQITDIHFNYINDRDREENDPLVMYSANDETLWLKNGASATNLEKSLNYAEDADYIVATGDLISYTSYGNIEMLERYIFQPEKKIMAVVGNHDPLKSWKAAHDESATLAARQQTLADLWKKHGQDMYYDSVIVDGRVMLIQMDNASAFDYGNPGFTQYQKDKLTVDLATARAEGYAVLMFYHVPLPTLNVKYRNTVSVDNSSTLNLYTYQYETYDDGVSGEVYQMIVNNADIIKGCFAGHVHQDYYSMIKAKTSDGEDTYIPQYIIKPNPTEGAPMLKITLR